VVERNKSNLRFYDIHGGNICALKNIFTLQKPYTRYSGSLRYKNCHRMENKLGFYFHERLELVKLTILTQFKVTYSEGFCLPVLWPFKSQGRKKIA